MVMKRQSFVGFILGLALLAVGIWQYPLAKKAWIIANPKPVHLALPSTHVGLETPQGQQLLQESAHRSDVEGLQTHFIAQQYLSYCGVASGVVAVNALKGKKTVDQDDWFDDRPADTRTAWDTFFGGMTLAQFEGLVQSHGLKTKRIHGGTQTLDGFRSLVTRNMTDPEDILVVNYHRQMVTQKGGGHFSPIAAYHEGSDRVLILDVAAHKYAPSWVPLADLWVAIDTKDSDSNLKRGLVVVSR